MILFFMVVSKEENHVIVAGKGYCVKEKQKLGDSKICIKLRRKTH